SYATIVHHTLVLPHEPPFFPTRRSSDLRLLLAQFSERNGGDAGIGRHRLAGRLDERIDDALLDRLAPFAAIERSGQRLGAGCTGDRKSTRLNSSHVKRSYAVFCLKKKSK